MDWLMSKLGRDDAGYRHYDVTMYCISVVDVLYIRRFGEAETRQRDDGLDITRRCDDGLAIRCFGEAETRKRDNGLDIRRFGEEL